MAYTVFYGNTTKYVDITPIVKEYFVHDSHIQIPANDDVRSFIFGDPLFGVLKHIVVQDATRTIYFANANVYHKVEGLDSVEKIPYYKLDQIQSGLKFVGGSIMDEYPEQTMAVSFIKPDNKVLEIGGNIGRNSCIIASLLKDSNNLVTLECDGKSAAILNQNRNLNNFKFHIEPSALSKRFLIQRGWMTIPSDVVLEGYTKVNTISWSDLCEKYKIEFDTLVLDCEGAFYWILKDEPSILKNIKTIIVENDYRDLSHKQYVDQALAKEGFQPVFTRAGGFGPCYDVFFQVWTR